MPNVFLIGMMGSGKTVTGRVLANLLKHEFLDFDEEIRKRNEMPISEIFEVHGEDFFRCEESAVLKEDLGSSFLVASTGGGIVLRQDNVDQMKERGVIVYLETSINVLCQRLRNKKDRPLLNTNNLVETLSRISTERAPLYEKSCNLKVNTDGKTAEEVAQVIWSNVRPK